MTTFVDTSALLSSQQAEDQDPVVVVVRSAQAMLREGLGETGSEKFEKSFAENYASQNFAAIFDLMLGNANVIFKKVAAADDVDRVSKTAEGYFEVCLSLLSKLETVEDVVSRIDSFIATVTGEQTVGLLRLKLLTTLFQTLSPKAELRLVIVRGMARFAASDDKLAALAFALVKDCDQWIVDNDWELSDSDKADLFGLVAKIATGAEKLRFLRLQVQAAPSPALIEALAVETLRETSVVRMDSFIPHMSGSTPAVDCVKTLASGDFDKMEKFVAGNAAFFTSSKISSEALLDKARVVALAKLAQTALATKQTTIALADVAAKLKTKDATAVVLRAVQTGLMVGSVDEVAGCVRIGAVAAADWSSVASDLTRVLKHIGA